MILTTEEKLDAILGGVTDIQARLATMRADEIQQGIEIDAITDEEREVVGLIKALPDHSALRAALLVARKS